MTTIVRVGATSRTDARTAEMLAEAERLGGNLPVTQGSYNTSVSASAGTHNGGGALDFSVRGLTRAQINRRVKALREVGFAAWFRPARPGVWGPHIHAIAIGTKDLAPLAKTQVKAYRSGRDGLKGNGVDIHRNLGVAPTTWERYQAAKEDEMKPGDVEAIVEAVWNADIVKHNRTGATVNSDEPANPDNPTWRPVSVLEETENRLRVVEEKLDRLIAALGK